MKLKFPRFQPNARTIYLCSVIIGIISGGVALLFYHAVHFVWQTGFSQALDHVEVSRITLTPAWPAGLGAALVIMILPVAGGLFSGLVSHALAPEARGAGTELFLDSFHHRAGVLRKRTAFTKLFTSTLTLGSGGSGGKEGPMMLIGAGMGSLLSHWAKFGHRARRTLFLAGAAGGLGAIFQSPLGGAITAVEVLYREDFESDALIPCIISSVTAYTVFGAFMGYSHMLEFLNVSFHSPLELIFYAVLGVICTGLAYAFVRFYRSMESFFESKVHVSKKYLPAVGGLFVGVMALVRPEILGSGLEIMQLAINGHYPEDWFMASLALMILAIVKIMATSFTVQSGGSAGVMIPSFYIGAMTGGAVGVAGQHFFPDLVPSVAPFVVVGMAACFSAATKASLGGLVMVTEITGGYELLPPLMVVCVISLVMSGKWSIYKNQVFNKFFSKAHLWDLNPSLLNSITVNEAFPVLHIEAVVEENTPATRLIEISRHMHHGSFLVRDVENHLLGTIDLFDHNLGAESQERLKNMLVAKDLLKNETAFLTQSDTLFRAVEIMASNDVTLIPVVEPKRDGNFLLGYITRRDILKFYKNSSQAIKK